MLLNLLIDAAVGAIPLFGDLFDFAFKSHVRNQRLLQGWLERPRQTQRSSIFVLIGTLLVLVGSVVGALWLVVLAVRGLYRLFTGSSSFRATDFVLTGSGFFVNGERM